MIHLWRANVDFAPVISMDDPDALGSGRCLQKTSGKNKTSDKDGHEPAYSGLAKNIVDRYTHIVCNGVEHPHDFVESVSGENISVQDVSLYDYASTGPQSNHPIGTYVPVASGLGYLKAVYPLRPCFCLSMLRLYKPGFTWGGSIIEGADGGPSVEQVIEFQSFLWRMRVHLLCGLIVNVQRQSTFVLETRRNGELRIGRRGLIAVFRTSRQPTQMVVLKMKNSELGPSL